MKNTLLLLLLVMFIYACQDLEKFEGEPINMGAKATSTEILSAVSVKGSVTAVFSVTTGAKYSVQVYSIGAMEPLKSISLTAGTDIVTKIYDFKDLPDGLYDLTLTDISGVSVKKPLVIKK